MSSANTQRWILAFLIVIGTVAALNPHLNITFAETVNENVTFAQNFNLVTNRTYSLINGVLTVTNPGTETVFDSYLKIINTDYLSSNFIYTSGANGSETVFPKNSDNLTNLSSNITASWLNIGDIDEDGLSDFVMVNSTNIIFNASSQYQLLSYPLTNTSGGGDLAVAPQTYNLTVNVTSVTSNGNYNDNVVLAALTINGTENTANQLTVGQVSLLFNDTQRRYVVLHIPELRSGQSTVFNYTVSNVLVNPPLQINTSYTNAQYQTKVLAGQYFNVTDVASNIVTVGPLNIINISIYSLGVNVSNSTAWQLFNFTLGNLQATGDYANVIGNGSDNRSWSWITNGGTIPIGQSYNISYQVRAPDTVPTSGTYPAVQENLSYTINATASTVGVQDVRARAEINFTTTKQIVSPQDNLSNHNVTWQSLPVVGSYENITFTLEKVTLWVTSTRDPNAEVGALNSTYIVNNQINLTSSWIGSAWLFNFTDGSSDVAPPPIIWIKPYWVIQNTGGQILNQSVTTNGTDIYIKYIYVVNGYWLEVFKNVTSQSNNTYNIQVYVHNKGNGHTPQNLTVTVYDFIPSAFTLWNVSPNFNNASNVSGQFNGTAYQWDVGLRTNLSTSFAPNGDPSGLDQYYLNYSVNGTGDFKVSDLYIVGLDPRSVEGANTQEGVTVLSSIASTSKELIYLGVVLFLIAINVGNFLMTSRINKKLDKKE